MILICKNHKNYYSYINILFLIINNMDENIDINYMKEKTKEFLEKLQLDVTLVEVEIQEENIYNVIIKTSDSSLIIWHLWKNLEDFRLVLKAVLSKNIDKKFKLHIEINDYISKKDDRLINYVSSKIDICRKTWKEIILPFLNAYERKKVHSYIYSLKDWDISSKSIWENDQRRLHIYKKTKTISIDMDWVWI